jgi:hypothetical protein
MVLAGVGCLLIVPLCPSQQAESISESLARAEEMGRIQESPRARLVWRVIPSLTSGSNPENLSDVQAKEGACAKYPSLEPTTTQSEC